MIVNYNKSFIKQLKKVPKKIRIQLIARIKVFIQNPLHSSLHNHSLLGEYAGYCSINITGDWRVIYLQINETSVLFIALGTHSQLYK